VVSGHAEDILAGSNNRGGAVKNAVHSHDPEGTSEGGFQRDREQIKKGDYFGLRGEPKRLMPKSGGGSPSERRKKETGEL